MVVELAVSDVVSITLSTIKIVVKEVSTTAITSNGEVVVVVVLVEMTNGVLISVVKDVVSVVVRDVSVSVSVKVSVSKTIAVSTVDDCSVVVSVVVDR